MKLLSEIDISINLAKFVSFCVAFIAMYGCTEPFDIGNENLEDFLVVNATITDKVSKQEVILSKTIGFEENTPIFETGATVVVTENNTKEYAFSETKPGIYESIEEFGISEGQEYQLSIRTQSGLSYRSEKIVAPTSSSSIENIYAERMADDDGVEGVGIFLNSFDASGNSTYYRFEYEETYKIIAPFWISLDLTSQIVSSGEVEFNYVERPASERICYKTELSNNINILNTSGLVEDRIKDRLITFIPVDDIRVAERYSILVKQYVQTSEAQSFYNVLSNFSESENVFSQIQPGFIKGNVFSVENPDENVLGYFDVSTISEERLFFSRDELINDSPVFELDCEEVIPRPRPDQTVEEFRLDLNGIINMNRLRIKVPDPPPPPGVYPVFVFVPRACGDCTAIGKSEIPDFWIE